MKWCHGFYVLPAQGIDFGAIRVVDDAKKSLVITNSGKYDVQFSMAIKSAAVKDRVTITPDEGSIKSGSSATIDVSEKAPKLTVCFRCVLCWLQTLSQGLSGCIACT
jgi:hypothetical protein